MYCIKESNRNCHRIADLDAVAVLYQSVCFSGMLLAGINQYVFVFFRADTNFDY